MQPENQLIYTPNIQDAINKEPLVLAPDKLLVDIIACMSQASFNSCKPVTELSLKDEEHISLPTCALIMQDQEIIGIITERDIVRIAAAGMDWTTLTAADVMAYPVKTLSIEDFNDIFAVMFLFRRYQIRHLPIVDSQNRLVGIAEPSSIRKVLKPASLLKLRRVSELMSTSVVCASPTDSLLVLAKLMAEHRVSCVVIVETTTEDRLKPVGIVTERDIVQFQAMGSNLSKSTAEDSMSTPLYVLNPSDSLWSAHQEMLKRKVRRLVVSWNWGQSLGIITQTSILKVFDPLEMYSIIETLQGIIKQLKDEKSAYLNQTTHERNLRHFGADMDDWQVGYVVYFLKRFTLAKQLQSMARGFMKFDDSAISGLYRTPIFPFNFKYNI